MNSEEPNFSLLDSDERNQKAATGLTGAPQAKLWKYVGWFVALIGALAFIDPVSEVTSELRARFNWHRTSGFVSNATLMSADDENAPGGTPGRHYTVYWTKWNVEFRPQDGCRTGDSAKDGTTGETICRARLHSIPKRTQNDSNRWLEQHPPGRPTELLYDPTGMGVKFADESLLYLVEWKKLLQGIGMVAAGITVILVTQKKLKELAKNSA